MFSPVFALWSPADCWLAAALQGPTPSVHMMQTGVLSFLSPLRPLHLCLGQSLVSSIAPVKLEPYYCGWSMWHRRMSTLLFISIITRILFWVGNLNISIFIYKFITYFLVSSRKPLGASPPPALYLLTVCMFRSFSSLRTCCPLQYGASCALTVVCPWRFGGQIIRCKAESFSRDFLCFESLWNL